MTTVMGLFRRLGVAFSDTLFPSDWKPAAFPHIVRVFAAVEQRLVIVADFTNVAAYDDRGLRRLSDRLSLDGVEIESVTMSPQRPTGSNFRLSV